VSEPKLNRYTSAGPGSARFVAQHLIMKPYIWSAVTVHEHGTRNLDDLKPPFVVIANHSSHLDAPLIFGALPRRLSKNLAAAAAGDYFFSNWYTALPTTLFFNSFPVQRSGHANRTGHRGLAGRLLADGIPILLFPEGTRSRTGAMANFTPGAAALSISRNVPVLPIALVGAYAAMPYGANVPVPGRPHVHVVFGRPLRAAPGEIAHQFSERLHRYVVEMHDTTARAYGMPTQADFARAVALRAAAAHAERAASSRRAEVATGVTTLTPPEPAEPSVQPLSPPESVDSSHPA
jgi:1-acyl-sn-glycerol-3-phosphate acyltransferase